MECFIGMEIVCGFAGFTSFSTNLQSTIIVRMWKAWYGLGHIIAMKNFIIEIIIAKQDVLRLMDKIVNNQVISCWSS